MPKKPIVLLSFPSPHTVHEVIVSFGKLPPSSAPLERLLMPERHSVWCALHLGRTTCDCDWFEKEGRP